MPLGEQIEVNIADNLRHLDDKEKVCLESPTKPASESTHPGAVHCCLSCSSKHTDLISSLMSLLCGQET